MPVHPNEPDTIRDVLPKDLRIALKQHWYRCQVLRETLEQNRFLDFTTSVGCELPVTSAEGANWRMLWSKVPGAIGFLRKRSTPKPGGHEAGAILLVWADLTSLAQFSRRRRERG